MKFVKVLDSGHELQLKGGSFGKFRVFWNGEKVEKQDKSYWVNVNGELKELNVKASIWSGEPNVFLDGKEVEITVKLKGYQMALSFLPLLLVLLGGALGGLVGVFGIMLNFKIFRSNMPTAAKVILSIIMLPIAFGVYFIVALAFWSLFQ